MDKLPKKNLTAKILALFFATVLWLYVMNEQNPPIETSYQIPLEVRNLSANLVADEVPDSVRVKVKGPRSVIAALDRQDIKSYIDVKGLNEGQHVVKTNVVIPPSLEVVEVYPGNISVTLNAYLTKVYPVELRFTGTAENGVVVTNASAAQTEVKITGVKRKLDMISRVIVMIDLGGKFTDFSVESPVAAIDSEGKQIEGLKYNPPSIPVKINLVNQANKKTVDVKTSLAGELPKGTVLASIITEPDKVEIYGSSNMLANVDHILTEPINLAEITRDTRKEVKLLSKEGISLKQNKIIVHIKVTAPNTQ